jgi:Sec-independent protein secretion pathway component TatC
MIAGYSTVVLHAAKYMSQALRNQERKSTVGLSPHSVLLDLLGSVFCLLQLLCDYIFLNNQSSYEESYGTPPNTENLNLLKLFLTTVSVACDFCFVMQHYVQFKRAVE